MDNISLMTLIPYFHVLQDSVTYFIFAEIYRVLLLATNKTRYPTSVYQKLGHAQ